MTLEQTPLGITRTIMPRDRALLHFNMASRRSLERQKKIVVSAMCSPNHISQHSARASHTHLSVILENLQHLIHPAHIQALREVPPVARAGLTNEATMLRRHTQILNVPQVLLQEGTVSPGDDVHDVARIGSERGERGERVLRRRRHAGDLDDRRESALHIACLGNQETHVQPARTREEVK